MQIGKLYRLKESIAVTRPFPILLAQGRLDWRRVHRELCLAGDYVVLLKEPFDASWHNFGRRDGKVHELLIGERALWFLGRFDQKIPVEEVESV